MVFNSLTFLVFFLLVVVLHHLAFSWKVKKFNLLVASYFFYGVWNPPFVLLLIISTLIDWVAGAGMGRSTTQVRRNAWLAVSLVGNLGMLSYFKYGEFLLQNTVTALGWIGIQYSPPPMDIILPIGISFYTFQTLSYSIDIWRGKLEPSKSFLDFAFFVTFFPQLVAGPIVRASEFLPQCVEPFEANMNRFGWGLCLMTLGLFQKVVLADTLLSGASEAVFDAKDGLAPLDAWLGVLAFSGQIFCDFAGYSTCAIGASLCLGFSLVNNFRFPFAACGFSDFWQRWHISLSRFLRDYVYISMGGNRCGAVRTCFNLMVTMLLGGLWHGASWTFVLWGFAHGLLLILERGLKATFGHMAIWQKLPGRLFLTLLTYFCILLTWVLFRAQTFPNAGRMYSSLFGFVQEPIMVLSTLDMVKVLLVISGLLVSHWFLKNTTIETAVNKTPSWLIVALWVGMLFSVILSQGGSDAFIYFQF
jgi:alginate O-acetyltransferase complex protein AlgI